MNEFAINGDIKERCIGPVTPDTVRAVDSNLVEVFRIAHDGRIFWRGREVETDDDFRTAMLELRDALMVAMK